MSDTTARKLQAGQDYDPGYDVPELMIGQRISGRTVIAAIREHDGKGLLPGLHVVTAYDADEAQTYVTWEVAWQPYSETERAAMAERQGIPVAETAGGRWVANAGHYGNDKADAVADMAIRFGAMRAAARYVADAMEHEPAREDVRAARRLRKWAN